MQERCQRFNWKKSIFPLFLALAAFVCFVILFWMGTVKSLNPMYIECLPFAIPFIAFLIIAYWAGKNQISELSTCIICIILVPVLVFGSWFYLFSLAFSSMPETVTNPSRYERTITRFVDPKKEWLAVFPDKIPKNAKGVSFYYSECQWLDYSETAMLKESIDGRLAEIDRKIQAEQTSIVDSLRDRQSGKITEEEYIKISRQAMYNVDNLNMERLTVTAELGKMQLADYRKEEIIKMLNTGEKLITFDETVFKSLVHEIKVTAPKEIEICYKCGITVKEQIK